MKKIGLLLLLVLMISACDSAGEKKAQLRLQAARAAFEAENFNEAKLQLDSIKILYPKAFDTRRQGNRLMLEVEYREQEKTIAFLDSLMALKQAELDAIKDRFVFEKDPEYQDIGNYFYPTQTVEKNINRSFLRAQVDEMGLMYLTSIYCGSANINHNAVKIIAPDGSYAETPASTDRYQSTDLGVRTEKVDYKLGNDNYVIGFITLNKDNNLRVEYLGGKKYTTTLSANDRKAIYELFHLSEILTRMEEIKKGMKEAGVKREFMKRKMEEGGE